LNLKNQKRMAARLMGCGIHRVWIDPNKTEDLEDAITRADIRTAIASGTIRKMQKKGVSRGRTRHAHAQRAAGRRRGHGSRKGGKRARLPKKQAWIKVIRPIRERLVQLKAEGRIDQTTYRRFYMQAKGGMFKNKADLEFHMRSSGHLKEVAK